MARDHTISIRSIRRPEPELRKLSRALIALAMAAVEAEAQAAAEGGDVSAEAQADASTDVAGMESAV